MQIGYTSLACVLCSNVKYAYSRSESVKSFDRWFDAGRRFTGMGSSNPMALDNYDEKQHKKVMTGFLDDKLVITYILMLLSNMAMTTHIDIVFC